MYRTLPSGNLPAQRQELWSYTDEDGTRRLDGRAGYETEILAEDGVVIESPPAKLHRTIRSVKVNLGIPEIQIIWPQPSG